MFVAENSHVNPNPDEEEAVMHGYGSQEGGSGGEQRHVEIRSFAARMWMVVGVAMACISAAAADVSSCQHTFPDGQAFDLSPLMRPP
eukprot:1385690-Rhodomonas_salina.1